MTLDIHNWSSSAHQELLKIIKDEIYPIFNQVDARVQNYKIQFLKEAAKFVRDFKSLANEADESLSKQKALEFEIERLLRVVVSVQKDITKGTCANTKFTKQSILGKPPSSSKSKLYSVTPFLNSKVIPKVYESNALSNLVTSNSAPSTRESKVVKNDNVIALRMFRINPSNNFRVDNVMPNKSIKASVRTKSITTSQPHVISQENVNSNSNGYPNLFMECRLGCSKRMIENLKLLINFVWKFLGTVCFGNDHVVAILNLKVALRRNTCFVRNLERVDLLKVNRTTNLYTINLHEMAFASPICLMARATSTKSWLWHQRLFHLNFDTINDLAKKDLITGLPKFKYHKEHLCPSCEQGKRKKASYPPKPIPNSK
ncbi:retrovirus-related pol polyprotein from transposon TNT 1-94 [Tanacetum coccineum]